MKYGMVAQIRVNTKDCLGILELMGVLGIDPYDGRSFAQCVSLSLSSMLQTMRDKGVISPDEDGFQYLNKMAPFLNSKNDRRKYVMSDALGKRMGEGIPAVTMPTQDVKHPGQYVPSTVQGWTSKGASDTAAVPMELDDTTRELLGEELDKLYQKLNSGDNLTDEEQARFNDLNKTLFG